MIDHLSYTHNLRSCEIRPGRDWTGPMISAKPMQCSTNCVYDCDDQSCLYDLSPQFKCMIFPIFICIFSHVLYFVPPHLFLLANR